MKEPRSSAVRSRSACLVLIGLMVVVAACGANSESKPTGSANKTATTSDGQASSFRSEYLRQQRMDGQLFSDDELSWLVGRLDSGLSSGAKKLMLGDRRERAIQQMGNDDQDVAVGAYGECVPLETLADVLAGVDPEASEDERTCVRTVILDRFSSSSDYLRAILDNDARRIADVRSLIGKCGS